METLGSGEATPRRFYQRIITSALGAPSTVVFPPATTPHSAARDASQLRNDPACRREHVMHMLSTLRAELDHLNAVLALPSTTQAGILTA